MMRTPTLTRWLFRAAEVLLFAGTVVAAALLGRAGEWHPIALVLLLLGLTLVGDWLSIEGPGGQLSGSLVGVVLTMALLGPVPAAAFSLAAVILTSASRRLAPADWLSNVSIFAAVPFAGGLMVRESVHEIQGAASNHLAQSAVFGLVVLGVFGVMVAVNFALFALHKRVDEGRSLTRQLRELFLPVLPGQLAAGMLATILAIAYRGVGLSMLVGSIAVLLILRHLAVALLRSEDRAEQLEARSLQLSGLQWGVLRTLTRVVNARDSSSGPHAAAVSRYAQALAREAGCTDQQCDVVHAAGLLHEIGKYAWPDRILHGEVLRDEDLEIVRNHPQEGAILVGTLDGYGEVADAILHHHERVDGSGYPAGLIGKEIPLASRILAICSTYDAMTSRRSYRPAIDPDEAMDELRHAARNGQLDSELVESFITLLQRDGVTFAKEANFETELDFERRVRQMAAPLSA
jgi:hypothetical protein